MSLLRSGSCPRRSGGRWACPIALRTQENDVVSAHRVGELDLAATRPVASIITPAQYVSLAGLPGVICSAENRGPKTGTLSPLRRTLRCVEPNDLHMTDHETYFAYLRRRKRAGLWYRNGWLYPRLCRHLRGRVLDVGCGIGDMVRFRSNTVGVDINAQAVAFCRGCGLDVHLMRPDRLPFAELTFDGAVLDNVLEHLTKPAALLAEIHRVLLPGGTLVVGVPGERGYASDPDHKRHYPEHRLIDCLKPAGFELTHLFHQPFRSALLDRHCRYYAVYGVFRRLD